MAGGQFGGGAGTAAIPYLVEDAADLNQVRNKPDAYYKLVSNINLGIPPYNMGKGWVPIANFVGGFNGNGKKIFNLFINRPDQDYVGLFSAFTVPNSTTEVARAQIKDLAIENADITGRDYVGAILGNYSIGDYRTSAMNTPEYSLFLRCYVQGSIKGRSYVGGMCGQFYWQAAGSTYYWDVAEDCFVDVTITPLPGGNYYGMMFGLIRDYWMNGQNNYFYMHNCIAKGKLDTSIVAAPTNVGVLCFHAQANNFNATDCRHDKTTWTGITLAAQTNGSVGLTTADMTDPTKFAFMSARSFNGIPTWSFLAGRYPELYFGSPDYLFVCGDNGYYTYVSATGWTKQYDTVPSRQQAIDKGMRHLEYVPQKAWDFFKTHGDPYIVNIMDKSDSLSIYETPFKFAQDVANSNSSKTIYRKEMTFNSFGGNLATINI
jgi:hypothetical protein